MPRLTDYRVLTFDCYGTLIDWECGIWDALQPLHHAQRQDRKRGHPRRRTPGLRAMREPAGAGHARPALSGPARPACTGASRRAWVSKAAPSSTRRSALPCRTGQRSRTPPMRCASSSAATSSSSCPTCTATASPPRTASSAWRIRRHLHRRGHRLLQAVGRQLRVPAGPPAVGPRPGALGRPAHRAEPAPRPRAGKNGFGLANAWIDRQRLSEGGSWGATERVEEMPSTDFVFFSMGEMAEAVRRLAYRREGDLGGRIERTYAIEQTGETPARCRGHYRSRDEAGAGDEQAAPHDEPGEPSSRCADRGANGQLPAPLGDGPRQCAEEPDHGDGQREPRETGRRDDPQPPVGDRAGDMVRQRAHLRHRQRRIRGTNEIANRGDQERRIAGGPHDEVGHPGRRAPPRDVQPRLRAASPAPGASRRRRPQRPVSLRVRCRGHRSRKASGARSDPGPDRRNRRRSRSASPGTPPRDRRPRRTAARLRVACPGPRSSRR